MLHHVLSPPFRGCRSRIPDSPSAPRRRRTALAALLVLAGTAASGTAFAGRPLVTDDAAIVDRGACQVETWIDRSRGGSALWLNPGCNPFGSTEFSLGGARIRPDGEASYSALQWQVKQLLRPFDQTRTGFALALGGVNGQGEDREIFLNGIASVPLRGESRLLHLNLGAISMREDGRRRTEALFGLAFDEEITEATWLSAEVFGFSGERASWQLGFRRELVPGHVQLDASAGSAFGRWPTTRFATLGLVFVTDPILP